MAGLTIGFAQTILDANFVSGDYIAYSANGSSETGSLARPAIGGWTSATAAAPSVKGNSGSLTSAAATGSVTVTHYAIYSASTSGTQKTDWTALTASKALGTGDTVSWAPGALTVTLD